MRTNLKVILTAIGVAVLASPGMAQPEPHVISPVKDVPHAHGSAARTRTDRPVPGAVVEGHQIRIDDCVHVTFPQCGGDATQSQFDRP